MAKQEQNIDARLAEYRGFKKAVEIESVSKTVDVFSISVDDDKTECEVDMYISMVDEESNSVNRNIDPEAAIILARTIERYALECIRLRNVYENLENNAESD